MTRLALVLVALSACGWPQMTPASTDGLAPEQVESYTALAHSLAGFMNARADTVEVDLKLAQSLERALLHARSIDDDDWRRGQGFFLYRIARARVPTETEVVVLLEADARWRARWEAGDRLTGEAALDALITTLDIQVTAGSRLLGGYYHLVVPREVNAWALENQLAKTPGFLLVSGWDEYDWGNPLRVSDDAWIRPELRAGGWKLKLGLGWGDCPAGCISGRDYVVDVDADGAARLVSATGDDLT